MTKFGATRFKLSKINSKVTLHLGPNGCGKSQSIISLEEEITKLNGDKPFTKLLSRVNDEKNVPVYRFTTSKDDIVFNNYEIDPRKLSAAFTSEGERISSSFMDWMYNFVVPHLAHFKPKKAYFLLDELDSGLSPDRIFLNLKLLSTIISVHSKHVEDFDYHIVMTSNSYELISFTLALFADVSAFWLPKNKYLDLVELLDFTDFLSLYSSRSNQLEKIYFS